jgi:predicted molibdopterin-dependent oxidoreductase YjgC
MVTLTINGRTIQAPEGTTVLRAADIAGITIPTLCDHPDLTPYGGCRLCVVEVEGSRTPIASCSLPVSQGMVITTESFELTRERQSLLELILSMYYDAGYEAGLEDNELIRWAKEYGVNPLKYMASSPRYKVDSDPNPFVWVDLNKCILCNRCIRACSEIQGRFVWGLAERGINAHIVAGVDTSMIDARCESCGACVAYCPTGALNNKMSLSLGIADRKTTTTCTYCGVGCQYDLNIREERITRVTSNPKAPVNGMALCVKGRYGYDFVHHPDRLTKPRVRRYLLEGHAKPHPLLPASGSATSNPQWDWLEVDWDTAFEITAGKLRNVRDTYGSDSIGVFTSAKCLNEENYLMNKFARQVVGTNNIDHCARL